MPVAPETDPYAVPARRVALIAIVAGVAIMLLKLGVYHITGSAAVLSDALESIINILAAGIMYFSIWLANLPADADHPYGHGKVEFIALGFEGGMVLAAGLGIGIMAIQRLFHPPDLHQLDLGAWLIAGIGVVSAALVVFVYLRGKRYGNPVLLADAKHLAADLLTTIGVVVGLALVRATGRMWLDPVVALLVTAAVLIVSWKLLYESINGLMDRADPADQATVCAILDDEISHGAIRSYHKVRMRHTGRFHWIDMHLQVNPALTVAQSHGLASRIEYRIEQAIGRAKATAHMEPADSPPVAPPDALPIAPPKCESDTTGRAAGSAADRPVSRQQL